MSQHCGNCVYLDLHEKTVAGDWFHGEHDEFKCTELKKYVTLTEGTNCRYYRYLPQKDDVSSDPCFITTVVVHILKQDDDCKILNTLRRFRKDVLSENEEGISLLRMYDVVGPKIVECINSDDQKLLLSYDLFANYLAPAAELVIKCKFEEAKELYVKMVNYLQIRYNICINFNNYVYDNSVSINEMGHGTARVHKVCVNN